jgi:hypothetical protein
VKVGERLVSVEVDKGRERSRSKDGGSSREESIQAGGTSRDDRPERK